MCLTDKEYHLEYWNGKVINVVQVLFKNEGLVLNKSGKKTHVICIDYKLL